MRSGAFTNRGGPEYQSLNLLPMSIFSTVAVLSETCVEIISRVEYGQVYDVDVTNTNSSRSGLGA